MLTLNVGFNRKVGEPNYGSRGASVNLEFELESGLTQDPDALRLRIRSLFETAKAAVEEELHTGGSQANGHAFQQTDAAPKSDRTEGVRRETVNQVRAIRSIAQRQELDADELVQSHYGINRLEELALFQASELIELLTSAVPIERDHG